ncbi:Poly(A)-specific ribonuclease PARN-like [Nymphaea thermarum]|nr:Poly(A)-specific ribonuclease PARN-like [Nymphaea thermarum]
MWPRLRRGFCSRSTKEWRVKQVVRSNFGSLLGEVKERIRDADFISISTQKSGLYSSPWRRILPIDTAETAYSKAKDAAERFQLFQFAVCPFRFDGTKVVAFPYNFHLFPRDELNIGMPSHSFSCQVTCLTAMAREGFDFNTCIYDGISYLSRVQEAASMHRFALLLPTDHSPSPSQSQSVADSVFIERIRSRIFHWRNSCKDSSNNSDEALVKSLRKLILGSELFGSRPCISVDVCNDHQAQLVLEMLGKLSDDLVPLVVPDKDGAPTAIRVVLTSSIEDKVLLENELKMLEDERNKEVRGFREVIDAMSDSQKPIIAYNCLNDFAFIHSKFISPLPHTMTEFMCSLRFVFPSVLDINHLLKEVPPLKKATNLHAALSFLKRRFFLPIDMEVPQLADGVADGENLGNNVLRITFLFAKLCSLMKLSPSADKSSNSHNYACIESYTNIFYPSRAILQEPTDGDTCVWMDSENKVNTENLVFLWGFGGFVSSEAVKRQLSGIHDALDEGFDVRLLDRSCAVLAFWSANSAKRFIKDIDSGLDGFPALHEMVCKGLKAATYRDYERVCKLGLWESELAESLDRADNESMDSPIMVDEEPLSAYKGDESSFQCW